MHARQLSSSQVNQETEAEFIRTRDSLQLGRRLLEDMKGEHKEKVSNAEYQMIMIMMIVIIMMLRMYM